MANQSIAVACIMDRCLGKPAVWFGQINRTGLGFEDIASLAP